MEKFELPNDDYIFEENVRKINKADRVHADIVNITLSALFKNSIWGKRHCVTREQLGIPEGQDPSVENQIPVLPKEPIGRENLTDGDNIGTIFSKVKKFFMDLKTVAFTGEYKDLSGAPTIPTVPGSIKNPYPIKANGKSYDGSVAVDIGTLGVGFGGTGATDAAGVRDNLGVAAAAHLHDERYYTETETNNLLNAKAASGHKHSAEDITSGTMQLARGGTGATDAAGVRAKLGLGVAATYGVANNCTTNVTGFALAAQQGKNLQDQINVVNSNLEECFQSVSDGKRLLASAITGKGVPTVSDATFQVMATNINKISNIKTGSISAGGTITLSFIPKFVCVKETNSGMPQYPRIAVFNSYQGYNQLWQNNSATTSEGHISVSGNNFSVSGWISNGAYIAVG